METNFIAGEDLKTGNLLSLSKDGYLVKALEVMAKQFPAKGEVIKMESCQCGFC